MARMSAAVAYHQPICRRHIPAARMGYRYRAPGVGAALESTHLWMARDEGGAQGCYASRAQYRCDERDEQPVPGPVGGTINITAADGDGPALPSPRRQRSQLIHSCLSTHDDVHLYGSETVPIPPVLYRYRCWTSSCPPASRRLEVSTRDNFLHGFL
jgi:hypothetical protein